MFGSDPLSLGVALAILAVIFAGVFLLLLRAAPRILVTNKPPLLPKPESPLQMTPSCWLRLMAAAFTPTPLRAIGSIRR
jgi:TRAP-type C4-dicarboxylate transport system permease small subunit